MSLDKKDSAFTHNQELLSNSFEIVSYIDEDDIVKPGFLFYEEPEEEFDSYEELKNYLYFKDEDSSRRDSMLETNEDGNVILRAPTKFSWGVILGGLTIAFNLIVSGTALYFYQTNLNEKMMTRLDTLENKIDHFEETVYSKREEDLMNENLKLELSKQNEMITRLEERYGR